MAMKNNRMIVMKLKKIIMSLIIVSLLITNISSVCAIGTGFEFVPAEIELGEKYLENTNFALTSKEITNKGILCFDVDERGWIAISFHIHDSDYIGIYDSDMNFQYGYEFHDSGSIAVAWDDENDGNLIIYSVRGALIVSIDPQGNLIDCMKVPNSPENDSFFRQHINTAKKEINGIKYEIRNDLGPLNNIAVSYSKLVKINPNGEETILYDVTDSQIIRISIITTLVIAFMAIFIVALVKHLNKFSKNNA